MRSPKFKFSQKDLEGLFFESGIRAAWRGTVKGQLKRQALQDIIDFKDFEKDIKFLFDNDYWKT